MTKPKSTTAAPARAKAAQKQSSETTSPKLTKLDLVTALLQRPNGASLAEMKAATGWQGHSVHGAMAGQLKKKRGLTITSEISDGVRRYFVRAPQ